jgi:ketosteroid isomerase-like protein
MTRSAKYPGLYTEFDLGNSAARLQQAFQARAADRVAGFLASNVIAMYAGAEAPLVGREANQQAWRERFAAPGNTYRLTVDEVVEAEQGDLGYTFGRWWEYAPDAAPVARGRWVAIWQPVGGAWLLTHLSANAHTDLEFEQVGK